MKLNTMVLLAMAGALNAQQITDSRVASRVGGGGGDGKCTIEVTVDGVAEVEIFGNRAQIRTLSGAPSSFRRFDCNQDMPSMPGAFRFQGVDGRGKQQLVRAASNGPAVVRIEDSQGGSEGYTFDLFWNGGSGTWNDSYNNNGSVFGGNNNNRFPNSNNDRYPNSNNDRYPNSNNDRYPNRNNDRDGYRNDRANNRYGGWNRNLTFDGAGRGFFRDNSRNLNVRLQSVQVRIDPQGLVDVSFTTNQNNQNNRNNGNNGNNGNNNRGGIWGNDNRGWNSNSSGQNINLRGQVERMNGNVIFANVGGYNNNQGVMEITTDGRDRVTAVQMRSNDGNNRWELNWRD